MEVKGPLKLEESTADEHFLHSLSIRFRHCCFFSMLKFRLTRHI